MKEITENQEWVLSFLDNGEQSKNELKEFGIRQTSLTALVKKGLLKETKGYNGTYYSLTGMDYKVKVVSLPQRPKSRKWK